MKNQALLSSTDESKKLKCRQLQFLFGTLRVEVIQEIWNRHEKLTDRQTDRQCHNIAGE